MPLAQTPERFCCGSATVEDDFGQLHKHISGGLKIPMTALWFGKSGFARPCNRSSPEPKRTPAGGAVVKTRSWRLSSSFRCLLPLSAYSSFYFEGDFDLELSRERLSYRASNSEIFSVLWQNITCIRLGCIVTDAPNIKWNRWILTDYQRNGKPATYAIYPHLFGCDGDDLVQLLTSYHRAAVSAGR